MSINIRNEMNRKIQVCVVKYDYEDYPDMAYFPMNNGESKTWERYYGRQYFAFVSDAGYLFGFLINGGRNYSYKQQGKLLDFSTNDWADFKGIEDRPGYIGIAAVIEDAPITFFNDSENMQKTIQKDDYTYISRPEGKYWIAYDKYSTNRDPRFKVEVGKSYYIAKGQIMVEANTNIIKKPWKPEDDTPKQ